MISQEMYAQVTTDLPDRVEQVHARHIVVDSIEMGEFILAQLQEGIDFATLAIEYSLDESTRLNGGDLDFFPRGLLLSPEVEETAFSLETGATSELVMSSFGYHIIQVLEKDPARPVAPEAQQRLREIAFESWLQELWATATVERNI
jgi:parvulin-like peptidyl-prolyl isomerase